MITYEHHTLGLFGFPLFSLVVATVFLAAMIALVFGVLRWRQPIGKLAFIVSAFILLLYALAIMLVLVTVQSGSMG